MTHRLWVLLIVFFIPALMPAQGVVDIIPAPDYSYGLTSDGSALWVGSSNGTKLIKIDTHTGAHLDSMTSLTDETRGLAWDGAYLWGYQYIFGSSASKKDMIIKYDTASGASLDTLASPYEDYIGGMCWADGYLWISVYYPQTPYARLIKIDPVSGAFVDTLASPGKQPQGLAYDGTHLWLAMDDNDGDPERIWQLDPATGDTISSFAIPPYHSSSTARPRDMAWDGQFLYLVVGQFNDKAIYKIDTGAGGTPEITLSANQFDFGYTALNTEGTFTLTISSTGTADLSIDSLRISDQSFSATGPVLPFTIPVDSSVNFTIHFSPDSYGRYSGNLDIYSSDVVYPQKQIALNGIGLYPDATAESNLSTIDFGSVWLSGKGNSRRYIGILNKGMQTFSVSGIEFHNAAFSAEPEQFPFTVDRDDTVYFAIRFEPDQAVAYTDTALILVNAANTASLPVELSGSGTNDTYTYGYTFWNYQVPDNPRAGSWQDYRVEGLRAMNDITGDGVAEVLAATDNYWLLCIDGASSSTADTIWAFNSYINSYNAGSIGQAWDYGVQDALAVATDLNNDGFNDVVLATGGGNEHVYAIDGRTGAKLWEYGDNVDYARGDFEAVDVSRDFTGDALPDVLAIADGEESGNGHHSAFLFNGTNGNVEWSYNYPGPNVSFGKTIIALDDINGDNLPDAAIAVGNNDDVGQKIYALDGQTGFPIWDFDIVNYEAKEMLEYPVRGGSPDIIAAEYFSRVYRLDGETGIKMWEQVLGSLAGIIQMDLIKDINGDKFDDILVASFSSGLTCLDGNNGTILWTHPMAFQYGVSSIPDLNNDGKDDVLTGDQNGTVYCLSGTDDVTLFTHTFNDEQVNSVAILPSIDGNDSFELLAGTDGGLIGCFSGGLEAVSALNDEPESGPRSFRLSQNYPNPFNPVTEIGFDLPRNMNVNLSVYNALGQKVSTLINDRPMQQGSHHVQFNASGLGSGVYYYRLQNRASVITRKMILLK